MLMLRRERDDAGAMVPPNAVVRLVGRWPMSLGMLPSQPWASTRYASGGRPASVNDWRELANR